MQTDSSKVIMIGKLFGLMGEENYPQKFLKDLKTKFTYEAGTSPKIEGIEPGPKIDQINNHFITLSGKSFDRLNLKTVDDRKLFWWIFLSWAYGTLGPKYSYIPPYPLYSMEDATGYPINDLRNLGRYEERKDTHFIKLDEFKSFLEDWGISLPARLFPEKTSEKKELHYEEGMENAFIFNGDYWLVKYNGKSASLRNLERIHYIVHLLENPNKYLSALDLYNMVKGTPVISITETEKETYGQYCEMDAERLFEKEGLSLTDFTIEAISEHEADGLKKTIERLYGDLEFAQTKNDPEKIKNANDNLNQMKRHLFNEYGLIFSKRKNVDIKVIQKKRQKPETDRVRINIKKQISNALNDIKKIMPPLSQHLRRYIETGKDCIYRPDPDNPINWVVRRKH